MKQNVVWASICLSFDGIVKELKLLSLHKSPLSRVPSSHAAFALRYYWSQCGSHGTGTGLFCWTLCRKYHYHSACVKGDVLKRNYVF